MPALLMQVLGTVGGLLIKMLVALVISPKFIYGLILKGLHAITDKTETKVDDEILAEAEKTLKDAGIPGEDEKPKS